MAVVELDTVTKTYGGLAAVAGASLRIEHGEFVALLGPSGCGKTTTLQMIAGFVEPTSGDIRVGAASMRGVPPHKRNIGVVFQSYALFPHLCVADNVAFGLKMRGLPRADIEARVARALDLVQLTSLDHRFPRELSGGQQQRVALARALVIEPSVLLLDEPLSNLDANLREQMRFEIREIQKRIGITTVFVTHDQNEAMAAADRLVVMSKGEIRQIGTPRQIYGAPNDLFVARFIGQANILRGKIADCGDGTARLALPGGEIVSARAREPLAAGAPAALALRPEDLRIAAERPPGMNGIAGTVTRVSYLGASVNAGVRTNDQTVTVMLPHDQQTASEGAKVFVVWPASAGILQPETP